MPDMAGALLNITDAGRAALVSNDHTATKVCRVMQIGLANAPFQFDPGMTVMPNEIKRVYTMAGENVAPDTIHVTIRDDSADQFTLYGFGLYLQTGVLLGVYCQTTPIMEKSPMAMLMLAADVVFKTLDVTSLTFGDASFSNPPATTERQGVVGLATRLQTIVGLDTQRAVTPDGLNARVATEERTGLVQLATDADVKAGKDDTKAVTPKKLGDQLVKKAELAGSNKQAFAVAQASAVEHAIPLGQADERYPTPASVKDAKDTATDALTTAKAALPKAGGEMTGIIDMVGSSNELRFTDSQQPITLGRFRMVSSGRALIVDRNTATNGNFSTFLRLLQIDGMGSASLPGTVNAGGVKTQTGVNLPPYNNDGKGFLEFGGDTVLWRLFSSGATGDLVLNTYNTNGTNKAQPLFINWSTGQTTFGARPSFAGAVPWDSDNLKAPLTAEGGALTANKGLTFGVGYGRSALVVSSNGTDSIGGAFADWNGNRTPALQVDTPSNVGAYMGIRWTQWGVRHLAAIDCYAGGSNLSQPYVSIHVGTTQHALSINGAGELVTKGAIKAGGDGAVLATNGNVYMSWAGQWLSEYLTNLNNGKAANGAQCQWASGIAEFGSVPTGESGGTADLPAPWVLVGLRNTFYRLYLRAAWLRN